MKVRGDLIVRVPPLQEGSFLTDRQAFIWELLHTMIVLYHQTVPVVYGRPWDRGGAICGDKQETNGRFDWSDP